MKRLVAIFVVAGSLSACRYVDEKELARRLDEIATVGSEAKLPGPRDAVQIAKIDAQIAVLTSYVQGLAK